MQHRPTSQHHMVQHHGAHKETTLPTHMRVSTESIGTRVLLPYISLPFETSASGLPWYYWYIKGMIV